MKSFTKKTLYAATLFALSTQAMSAAFQILEQDGASVANFHAGYAALAENASTAFYNPAGITRIKNQQLVLGSINILTEFKYEGLVGVNTVDGGDPNFAVAKGGRFNFIPAFHYVAPISDKIGFGFSVDIPFGLETDYHRESILRYAATKTAVSVIDISPSLGFQVSPQASLGVGLDIQRMDGEFNQVGVLGEPLTDTESKNKFHDTGIGFHLGGLYQFTPCSRVGLSYHSEVKHHLKGKSRFDGPLALVFNDGPFSSHASTKLRLPGYTALSIYNQVHPRVALMGTVMYVGWDSFRTLVLHNVAGIQDIEASKTIDVKVREDYRNTWNVSVGADYYATDKLSLRIGGGYDQTPVRSKFRNVQLPDNDHYALAFGGHYQATKHVGFDLGYMHVFMDKARIDPPPQASGDQVVTTKGFVKGAGAEVIGAQVIWDIV